MASWLYNAIHQSNKPKQSIIGVLKQNLGGQQLGRLRETLHASDVTKPNFCPRKWALDDLQEVKVGHQYVSTAMDVTFQMGLATERLLMEEWGGDAVIGNWACRRCHEQRTMQKNPRGNCSDGHRHSWEYIQLRIDAPKYGVSGGIDGLFDVGNPRLLIAEIKTLNPDDFDKIMVPQPEHRLRTNLYMKLIEESDHPYKDKFNVTQAHVLYISRAYGRMNAQWNEILPFKEFVVHRDNTELVPLLQRAGALKLFRETQQMPPGICGTALDPVAKKCSKCKECFSGKYPAAFTFESVVI